MLQREEEEEARRRLQMATALVDGAERWRESLRGLRHAPLHHVVGALACFAMLAYYVGEHLSLGLAILWAGVQFTVGCRPSCCRTTGAIVMLLFSASALVSPGAGVLATPFFEITLCHNTSGGATTLYGMRSASVGALDGIPTATCVSTPSEPPVISVALNAPDLDADRDYRPVFLVPSDAHASLTLAVHDATGQELYMPTRLELGAADEFPWARVKLCTHMPKYEPTPHESRAVTITRIWVHCALPSSYMSLADEQPGGNTNRVGPAFPGSRIGMCLCRLGVAATFRAIATAFSALMRPAM